MNMQKFLQKLSKALNEHKVAINQLKTDHSLELSAVQKCTTLSEKSIKKL